MIQDKELFIALFSDLKDEVSNLGYSGCEGELFNEMLLNHFGLEIEDSKQLDRITSVVLRYNDLTFLGGM